MVTVEVPVKLRVRAGAYVAAVTLTLTPRYRSVYTAPATPVPKAKPPTAVEVKHASAASHVSRPELLLPPEAVHGRGKDSAETWPFSIAMSASRHRGSVSGRPLLVRLWTQDVAVLCGRTLLLRVVCPTGSRARPLQMRTCCTTRTIRIVYATWWLPAGSLQASAGGHRLPVVPGPARRTRYCSLGP